jgi:hypothetical protein
VEAQLGGALNKKLSIAGITQPKGKMPMGTLTEPAHSIMWSYVLGYLHDAML